jgi:hypothetical protein
MTEFKHKYNKTNTPFIYVTCKSKEMDEVLKLFDIKQRKFKCPYCQEEFTKKKLGGIMPDKNGLPMFLCKSPLCMFEYMEDFLVDVEELLPE